MFLSGNQGDWKKVTPAEKKLWDKNSNLIASMVSMTLGELDNFITGKTQICDMTIEQADLFQRYYGINIFDWKTPIN